MFTIKHVWDNGFEHLYDGEFPQYIPPAEPRDLSGPAMPAVVDNRTPNPSFAFTDHEGERRQIWGGTVYVMNVAGKTVGTYRLGDRPYHQSEQPIAD